MPLAYQLIYFLTPSLLATLAALIFFQRPGERLVQAFAAFILSITGWIVTLYLFYTFTDSVAVLFVGRWNFVFGELIGYFAFLFAYLFPTKSIALPRQYFVAVALVTLLLVSITAATDLVDANEIVKGVERITEFGAFYILFPIYFLWLFIAGIVLLILKYRKSDQKRRKQILIFASGWGFSAVFATVTNILLAPLTGNYELQNLGPVGTLALAGATGYAVARLQLMDIKAIATEFFVAFLLLLFVANIATAPSLASEVIGSISLFVGALLGLALIRSVRAEVRRREEVQTLATKLAEANEHLKEIDAAKSDFISIASHQLRTPVSVIKGYLSLLMEGIYGKVPEKAKPKIESMFVMNERLVQLINNLLNISRIEKKKIEFIFAPTDVPTLARNTVGEMAMRAKEKGIEIRYRGRAVPPARADEAKLKEVITNLIDNAIKYSRKGAVTVSVDRDADGGTLLRVEDNGIGLTSEQITKLFQKYYRVESPETATTAGTGLGLYVCSAFVRGMGGSIYVERSEPGKGSVFAVKLRQFKPGDAAEPQAVQVAVQ